MKIMSNIYSILDKQIGVTDEYTACDCCGKEKLKRTVVFSVKDGLELENTVNPHFAYLGTTCATNVKRFKGVPKRPRILKKHEYMDLVLTGERGGIKCQLKFETAGGHFYRVVGNNKIHLRYDDDLTYTWNNATNWEGDFEAFKEALNFHRPELISKINYPS